MTSDLTSSKINLGGHALLPTSEVSRSSAPPRLLINQVPTEIGSKGATSSKRTSRRYGTGFERKQVFDHVAKAVHTALAVVARDNGTRAALAVPDDQHHRHFVGMVSPVLARLGVATFFVKGPGIVRVQGNQD